MKINLIGENNYENPIEQVFINRGIENYEEYINVDDSVLSSYEGLHNVFRGVELLCSHLDKESKMLLVVDPDADGNTSAAMIYNYLHELNPFVDMEWQVHTDKIHGLKNIEVKDSIDLVIVPDAGSNDFSYHKELNRKGIDVLIIDHHEAEYESEDAVIVNNQFGDYNRNLTGATVVLKFLEAMDDHLRVSLSQKYWDLAAVGTIADSSPMSDFEVRYIVNEGLKKINNVFLDALIEKQSYSLKGVLNNTSISFYIAPLINAVLRVGSKTDKIDMFKSFIESNEMVDYTNSRTKVTSKVYIYADMARRAGNLKAKQGREVDKFMKKYLESEADVDLNNNVIVLEEDIESGLTGYLAMKLSSFYQKPVALLRKNANKSDILSGSVRNYDRNGIKNVKDLFNETEVDFARGHQSAFGLQVKEDKFDSFKSKLYSKFKEFDLSDEYFDVDFSIPAEYILDHPEIFEEIDKLKDYWGKGVEEPIVHIKDVPLIDCEVDLLGKLQNTIAINYGDKVKFMIFKTDEQTYNSIIDNQTFGSIDVVGRININEYKGEYINQLMVDGFEVD